MSNNLDQTTLEKIKKDLETRKTEILKAIEKISKKDDHEKDGRSPNFPNYGDELDENVLEVGDYSTNLITEEVLEKVLVDIDEALKNIENNTYGSCKYCKKPINPKRLLARPVASACIDCKEKLQKS